MTTLPNFPMISQLGDGDINAEYDCVPASIAAGLEYLTRQKFTGGQVKDAVYGASYQGPTEIGQYIEYCLQHEVALREIKGTGLVLSNAIVISIQNGWPVLGTEPDPYSKTKGMTHVVTFYEFDDKANTITAMDPYIAKPVTRSHVEWADLLVFSEVWAMEREAQMGGIPKGWSDDGKTLKAPGTDKVIVFGFRDWILSHYWHPDDIPVENEVHCNPLMQSDTAKGGGQRQRFKYSTLGYTPKDDVFLIPGNQEIITYEQNITTINQGLAALAKGLKPFM